MKSNTIRRVAASVMIAGIGYTAFAQPPAPAPAPVPTLIDASAKDYGTRPVAYLYDNTVPVTRAELAEFLIARGGYEKVELLVNKKIIENEAARRGITVTQPELESALNDDLKGIDVTKEKFIEVVLAKYGKTFYEWMEDIVRPRLLLTKMCQQDVVVTEEDLKKEFERMYGEKRRVQLIIWPKGDDFRSIARVWDEIRKDPKRFDNVASQQANPGLASTAGHVSPIGRNLTAEEKVIEEKAFSMQPGDVSAVFMTSQGYTVIKCVEILKADDKVTLDSVRETISKSVRELKLASEIPKYFEKLKTAAKPNILLNGPPTQWQFQKANRELAEDVLKSQKVQPAGAKQ